MNNNLFKLTFAVTAVALLSSGCSTVRYARDAQNEKNCENGERVMAFEATGLDATKPCSLEQLEAVAIMASPQLLQARQAVVLAQLAVRDIDSSLVPTLDASIGYTYSGTDVSGDWTNVDGPIVSGNLSWLLYDFGKTSAASAQALANLTAAEHDLRTAENGTRFGVRSACFALRRAQELQSVAEESVSAYAEHLKQMQDRLEVGAVNSYAVTKAQVDFSDAKLSLVTASNSVKVARTSLNAALALIDAPELQIAEPKIDNYADKTVAQLMEIAYTNAPTLASLKFKADGAKHYVDKTIADLYPNLGINLKYDGSFDDDWISQVVGTAALTESIFSAGRKRRAIEAAVAQLRIARSAVAAEELALFNQLTTAHLNATRAIDQLNVAKESAQLAQENYNIVASRYEVGSASELERTDAQVALTSAKAAVVSAQYDYYDAQVKIANLVGE
ncbi:MAG: TolC family protein [Kiritimatiellae bacterium]|nr:TolC family protein [Kiritimatiellia bacterium]